MIPNPSYLIHQFGLCKSHVNLRKMMMDYCKLNLVVTLPAAADQM